MFKVKIDIEAVNDIQEIIDWYNFRQKGLGKKFHQKINKQISSLAKNADIYELKYDDIRWVKTEKFPYTIHYKIINDIKVVQIIGVFYSGRNPQLWKERAK